jgi:hypothetical protein
MTRQGFASAAFAGLLLVSLLAACGSKASRPAREARGQQISTCPVRTHAPPNRNRAARGVLVPHGATGLLLCRYYGMNTKWAGSLAASRRVSASQAVARWTKLFDHLPPGREGLVACPSLNGPRFFAFFSYRREPTDVVAVIREGCGRVDNEANPKAFAITPPLLRRLLSVLPLQNRYAPSKPVASP